MPSKAPSYALRARLGAYVLHSRYDARETTAAARSAFAARFELEVDPDGTLPLAERTRRAAAAKSAYYVRLAMASAKVRARKASVKKSPAALADATGLETLAGEVSRDSGNASC